MSDVRYAIRSLWKNLRFTVVAVSALALGIGANAAIFSVVNVVLLQPLPYPDASRLVRVCREFPTGQGCAESIPKYLSAAKAQSMDAIAAYDFAGPGLNLSGQGLPRQIKGIHVSASYFRVFGAAQALGRTFTDDEDRVGGPRVAVLAYGLWMSHFGGDPAIGGKTILLNGDPYTIVGVLAARFRSEPAADVFIPLQPDPNSTNQGHYLSVAGHLKAGVTLAQARAEMKLLGDQFRRAYPKWMDDKEQAGVFDMQEIAVQDVRPMLLVLLGAVGLVLLIACANVANLLLARAAGRQREVAIRAAIGAGRGRIVRQLLIESLLLSGIGAIAGCVAGVWGARVLVSLSPAGLPRAGDLAGASLAASLLDWRLFAFLVAVTLVTGLLFGIAPALHLSRADVNASLKESSGRGVSSRRAARTRDALVVVEIALALMLLVGATLLIRTVAGLRDVQPGFDTRNVLTLQTSLAGSKYQSTRQVETLTKAMIERLNALPGVQAAAMTISLPTEGGVDLPFRIEGRALQGNSIYHGDEQWRSLTPEYFKVFGIPLMRGRVFTERDTAGTPPVVLVNDAMAKKYWPGADPVGQQLMIGQGLGPEFEESAREVVGIVANVREAGLSQDPPPVVYVPAAQITDGLTRLANNVLPASWIVRTSGLSSPLIASIQQAFLAVDGQLPVARIRPMEEVVGTSIQQQNFNMLLLTVFGAIALVLAAIGIYGLMSYAVEQGTRDIGVRLALGAAQGAILRMVVTRGLILAGIGLVIGLAGALAASRLLSQMLYGVRPSDPATYAAVTATLGGVALLACYLPARRATRVDPIIALRAE